MKTAQTSQVLPTAEPATKLERLYANRAALTSELAALNASSARLRQTADAEAAVLREIGAMGSAEIDAVKAWASAGCVGDQPAPDLKVRRALAEKLSAAQAAAAAARGAGADIDQKIAALNEQLRSIAAEIDQAIFDRLETEHGFIIDQYRANCELGSKLAAQIHGLASFYGDTGRTLISRGNQDAGMKYLQLASGLTSIKLPNPGVTRHEIEAAANEWGRRAATLRIGK